MREAAFYILSSFWAGAVHAATPGHGKTIAAAYIVGARGRPIDAVILGVFVTLSHVSGIVLVGVLASMGSAWLVPQRIEAWLALALGVFVIGLGAWMLWLQRELLALAMGEPSAAPAPQTALGGAACHEGRPEPSHARAHGTLTTIVRCTITRTTTRRRITMRMATTWAGTATAGAPTTPTVSTWSPTIARRSPCCWRSAWSAASCPIRRRWRS